MEYNKDHDTQVRDIVTKEVKSISRVVRRIKEKEHALIEKTLRALIVDFFEFRRKQADKNGADVAIRLEQNYNKWKTFAHKKFKTCSVKLDAFKENVDDFLKKEENMLNLLKQRIRESEETNSETVNEIGNVIGTGETEESNETTENTSDQSQKD